MPELPDLTIYVEALRRFAVGRRLERIRLASPFVLRTADPPLSESHGKTLGEVRRIGKRIIFILEGDFFLVVHLMIAGRLRWKEAGAKIPGRVGLAAFDFPHGTLLLTEAGTKRRASLHLARGESALKEFDHGGLEPLRADFRAFQEVLTRENHTLKRALTDPRLFSGIGNAYSDEILHRARLSPVMLTGKLDEGEMKRLFQAMRDTLAEWITRLRAETGEGFPENVTAFREGMAVHGRYGKPCPVCRSPVQRIVHAENESNYCATCQTGGRLLADRALSRLLKSDWPKTIEEWEEQRRGRGRLHPRRL
ncbi:MAG: formamidopyrimidine-DNA glycosylase [Candidatus Tectomicrobia bacterium]|uniref:Formamidopyrimidine-DNA glycosylase n=1 Tax=Tectimicrobiota bacterium TaxID=2528274 RepID=A0A932GN86_UNCTE|nr:formamidopyrimidine-DNA glycosylase [Candidatus Tectomicrobia bacterium]